jgi:16S rRNA processing protein RimM
MEQLRLIKIGKISNTHGLRGEVKILSYSEHFKDYKKFYFADQTELQLKFSKKKNNKFIIASINEVDSIEDAENFKGKEVFIDYGQLDHENKSEDEFFQEDLINLRLRDKSGKEVGKIIAVNNFGGGDVVEVGFLGTKTAFFQFKKEVFPEVDLEKGEGIFCEPEEI